MGFPGGSGGKESACNVGDPGLIPGLGRCPGEGNGSPLQYSCLGNPMDKEAWWTADHGAAESDMTEQVIRRQVAPAVKNWPANLGDIRHTGLTTGSGRSPGEGNGNPLQHSCLEILWTEKPGRPQSTGLQRVRHD